MQTIRLKREKRPYEINEELKLLRTNLLFCGAEKHVFLMTSAFAGEGKSTVVYDLCQSLAELGKNVILIDADMRKSMLKHKVIGTVPDNGLSHYLSGQCELEDVVCQTDAEQLYVVLAGAVPPNPTELLASDNMKRLISFCREHYDYIVVNSDIEECTGLMHSIIESAIYTPERQSDFIDKVRKDLKEIINRS